MSFVELLALLALGAVVWFWFDSLKAREIGIEAARRAQVEDDLKKLAARVARLSITSNAAEAEVLIDEEAPIAPVYFYVKSRLLKPNVKGYPYQNPQDLVYAKDLYLTAQ